MGLINFKVMTDKLCCTLTLQLYKLPVAVNKIVTAYSEKLTKLTITLDMDSTSQYVMNF